MKKKRTAFISLDLNLPENCNTYKVVAKAKSYLEKEKICDKLICSVVLDKKSKIVFSASGYNATPKASLYVFVYDELSNVLPGISVKIIDYYMVIVKTVL